MKSQWIVNVSIYKIILDLPLDIGGEGLKLLFGMAATPILPVEEDAIGRLLRLVSDESQRSLILGVDLFCLEVIKIFSSSVVSSHLWNEPLKLEFRMLLEDDAPKLIECDATGWLCRTDVPSSADANSDDNGSLDLWKNLQKKTKRKTFSFDL